MHNLLFKAVAISLFVTGIATQAQADEPITPLSYQCLQDVSQRYGIHTDVLFAILMVEGGTVGKDNAGNTNGTYDIGPFQINSMHLPEIRTKGITESQLRNNGCTNANVAAWILQRSVMNERVLSGINDEDSYLKALARYHSATPVHNERYAGLLRNAFSRLYASQGSAR
ncbi:hypothetical protein LCGC14_0328170 [marine sediment metagenome]|uniref:Transglycosylase SLT domain-containing protein n=1 Tax=marine sediment metagenome TaxID=412755 RepID=A0A0F9WPF8_9ZZZZ